MFADIKIDSIAGIICTDITFVIYTGLINLTRTGVIRTVIAKVIPPGITSLGFCRPGPRVFLCQRRNREKRDQHEQAEK